MQEYFGEIGPVLIIAMILGLVELIKKSPRAQGGSKPIYISMGVGVFFGVTFQLQAMYPVIAPWFRMGFYGILMGLAASGLYKLPASMGFGSRAKPKD